MALTWALMFKLMILFFFEKIIFQATRFFLSIIFKFQVFLVELKTFTNQK